MPPSLHIVIHINVDTPAPLSTGLAPGYKACPVANHNVAIAVTYVHFGDTVTYDYVSGEERS